MTEMTYRDALKQALRDAMTEDDNVMVIGEEVGRYGGAYGVTKGLYEEFGAERMIDTPISEPAIVGAAVGAAMSGLRPVAELMYVDFIGMTMDQLAICLVARLACRWSYAPKAARDARLEHSTLNRLKPMFCTRRGCAL